MQKPKWPTRKRRQAMIDAVEAWAQDNDTTVTLIGTDDDNVDYAPAIIGVTHKPHIAVVYSMSKLIECFMHVNKWSHETATEWVDFNVVRALPYYGNNSPILVEDLDV
jgi:hypothetical protein